MSDPAAPPRLTTDQRLGPFAVLQLIKEGGQATVYLARIARDQPPAAAWVLWQLRWLGASPTRIANAGICALKVANPGKRDSLNDEHTYLTKVRSALKPDETPPHLVSLYHSSELRISGDRQRGVLDGFWKDVDSNGQLLEFIALPYISGGALDSFLRERRHKPLPAGSAIAITLQLCQALQFLHERVGLVHHDISPSNIVFVQRPSFFLPRPPQCILVDLAAADSPTTPRLRSLIGKLVYLPPQRINRTMKISPAIDIYGLGVVLYEMLVGQLPHPSIDQDTKLPLPLPALTQQRPDLSPELINLVHDTISHDDKRWPSLPQFQARLEATPEFHQPLRLRGHFDQRVLVQSIAAIMLLSLLVFGLFMAFSFDPPPPPPPSTTSSPTNGLAVTVTPWPTATLTPEPVVTSTPTR